jgi:phage tail-like protein
MNHSESTYMNYLPSVFYGGEKEPFIGRYLKIFEKIMSGIDDGETDGKKGILEMLDIISDIFYPRFSFMTDAEDETFLPLLTPDSRGHFYRYFGTDVDADEYLDEFLRWLASWMALVLKEDWELEKKREVITRILPLYRMRGTKKGLEEYLKIYVGKHIIIIDETEPFQIGVTSHVGKKARIGGLPPYFFIVEVDVMYLFSWDDVPGVEGERLLHYLNEDFDIFWAEGAEIRKSDDGRIIHIYQGENSADITMDEKEKIATLKIKEGQTFKLNVKKENGKFAIYNERNIKASQIKKWRTRKKAIEEIVDSERPAHTDYWLNIKHPRMTVGVNSRIGENTLL